MKREEKATFKQKNPFHKLFPDTDINNERVWIVYCMHTGGTYKFLLSKNKCLCCKELLK